MAHNKSGVRHLSLVWHPCGINKELMILGCHPVVCYLSRKGHKDVVTEQQEILRTYRHSASMSFPPVPHTTGSQLQFFAQ